MKFTRILLFIKLFLACGLIVNSQNISITSPDSKITVKIENAEKLLYAVDFNNNSVLNPSSIGFQFKGEADMPGNFVIINQTTKTALHY